MGFCGKCLLLSSIGVAVFLGYRYYQPVPSELIKPNDVRGIAFGFNLADLLADGVSTLRIASWSGAFRDFFQGFIQLSNLFSSSPPLDNVIISYRNFDGVRVGVYDPPGGDGNRPVVLYIHGGGWIALTLDNYLPQALSMAKNLGALVISIDYRLKPFPIPFEDCRKAVTYFLRNVDKFNVNPKRIAIAGDSAGGNLAAAIAQYLREVDIPNKPKVQVLIYPALQALDLDSPSYQENQGILLTKDIMTKMYLSHAGASLKFLEAAKNNLHISKATKLSKYGKYVSRELLPARMNVDKKPFSADGEVEEAVKAMEKTVLDPRFSPLLADDLKGLPDTLMITCEYDPLRDDGFMYVARLKEAAVQVEHINFRDLIHGAIFYDPSIFQKVISFLKEKL